MKIAFVIPTLEGGGAERVVSRLSLFLAKSHLVTVITWNGRNPAFEFGGQIIDVALPAMPTLAGKFKQQKRRILALADVLNRIKPDKAIGVMDAANVPLLLARGAIQHHMHLTVSIHTAPAMFGGVRKWNMRRVYPRADRIALLTRAAMRTHISQWSFPPDRCCVIPNPVDDEMLSEPPTKEDARETGLVVAVGRLVEVKEHVNLIEAFALSCHGEEKLMILGEGPLRPMLEKRIAELGLSGRVILKGHCNDVRSYLDRAALFVISSRHEGFPVSLAEAMARGCPVISTDCPTGPGEMIEHGRSGWLVPVGEVAALANAMTEALRDRRRAEQFGRAARKRAEEWAIDRIAPRWIEDA